MNETEARKLALSIALDMGAKKHWHRPYIRFGSSTVLTFNDPEREESHRLATGDGVYLDLGPVWGKEQGLDTETEGDVGDSFVFGDANPKFQALAETTRLIWTKAQEHHQKTACSGLDLYKYICAEVSKFPDLELVEDAAGHIISDFPHKPKGMGGLFTYPSAVTPLMDRYWILELMLKSKDSPSMGAFYEDLL